jgi:DNA-binding transcriptional ArsR family regulator
VSGARRQDGGEVVTGEVVASRPLSEIKAELFRALAHPGRVRVLEILRDGERTVAELVPLVGLGASHLSQQLAVLRRARVVIARRQGARVTYAISDPEIIELLAAARRFLINSLSASEELLAGLRGAPPLTP